MGVNKKNNLSEEHLRKIVYRSGYMINESPRYRQLVDDSEVFDEVPLTNEAGGQEDSPEADEKEVPREPSNMQSVEKDTVDTKPPVPEFDPEGDDMVIPPEEELSPMGEPSPDVDEVQNEIIKHNIEAMKSINSQLENLSNTIDSLNGKIDILNQDVDEVREPTNVEKLMNKKDVSYPYYFNLNDYWKNNWFNENRVEGNEKGIRELPDGTFIADFDDLPQKSSIDIKNSFNEY